MLAQRKYEIPLADLGYSNTEVTLTEQSQVYSRILYAINKNPNKLVYYFKMK